MINDAYEKLKLEFENRRDSANEKKRRRREEIFAVIPEFEMLDDSAKAAGIDAAKKILRAENDAEKEEISAELNRTIDSVMLRKSALLTENGYPADYLEDVYQCGICKDQGYYMSDGDVKVCGCYVNCLTEMLQSVSGIGSDDQYDLEKFQFELFDDNPAPERYGIACSPRENIKNIYDKVCVYLQNEFCEKDGKSLFFTGGVGTGKTFMSKCIGHYLVHKGHSVLYLSAPELFDTIMTAKYDEDDEVKQTARQRAELIREVDCLIIDDIGTEKITDAKISELLSLLNYRFELNKNGDKPYKMIVSTNIPAEEINKFYEDSIASRIWGEFRMFKFAGNDLRLIR